MTRVKVLAFAMSLDGFGAGADQSLAHPLGVGGEGLHQWFFPTRVFRKMMGDESGTTGVDNDFAERSFDNIGAWIMGRNMFGPIRGSWSDESWKGWWGETPPFHVPVFVLTHHPRAPIEMQGGTTFHFVTEGPERALDLARRAASGGDVRIGGGPATVRQYLRAGVVDEMHLVVSPVLLGRGEPLLHDLDLHAAGFTCTEHVGTEAATHVVLKR